MPTQKEVMQRRNTLSNYIARSVTNAPDLARMAHVPYETVRNDLKWMSKNSKHWLSGWSLHGFVFATKNTIEQLESIELELQSRRADMIQAEKDKKPFELEQYLKVLHELKDVINLRWAIQGEGPTLMYLKSMDKYAQTSPA